jgi:hypothetical protein
VSALPLPEARKAQELTEEFLEEVGRQFLGLPSSSMTPEQRQAAIESTAAMICNVDALIARVDLVDGNTQAGAQAELVHSRLKGLRAVVWLAMKELNPDQAWFWTEEWQTGQRRAEADIVAGRTQVQASTEDFLATLDNWRATHAHA